MLNSTHSNSLGQNEIIFLKTHNANITGARHEHLAHILDNLVLDRCVGNTRNMKIAVFVFQG